MPDAFDEVFGPAAPVKGKAPDAFDEVFGAEPTSEIEAIRKRTFGDVADESKMPVEDADRVALLDRFGARKVVKGPGGVEAFYDPLAREALREARAKQQADMDAKAFAGLEAQTGPVKTKADVRRLREAADIYEANQSWKRENPALGITSISPGGIAPMGVEPAPKFADPMEARRYLDAAPERRRARYEYESEGKFPFAQALARRAALGATAGQFDIAKTFGSDQEQRLVGEAEANAGKFGQIVLGAAETAGMMSPVGRAANFLAPELVKAGLREATAAAAANLIAGSIHGGVSTGSVEGAVETGLFMGGQSALGRVFRGAAPTAGRYAGSELGAGATASLIAQMVSEGQADPVKALADGVVNALFGLPGARAAGRARRAEASAVVEAARQRVMEEIRKGRELQDIMRDQDFAAMVRQVEPTPGDPEAMLAEPEPIDPMVEARRQREMAKASVTPVEAPLERPSKRAIPPDESMVGFIARVHESAGVGKRGGSDMNRVLRERFGITEEHADHILLRAVTEGAIPRDVAEFQGIGLPKRNFRGRGPERVAAAEAGIVDAQGKPKWDLFSREAPPDTSLERALPFIPGDRVGAPRTVDEALPTRSPLLDEKPAPRQPVPSIWGEGRPVDFVPPKMKGKRKPGEAVPMEDQASALADYESPRAAPTEIPAEPTARPGKAAERGAVSLEGAGSAAAEGVRRVLGRFSQALRDRGTPSARELADKMEKAADVASREEGPLSQKRRDLEQTVIRNIRPAMRVLNGERVEGQNYALSNADEVLAGRKTMDGEGEAKIIAALDTLSQARGVGFENVGTMRTDPKTGEVVPFKTPPKILPRVFHSEGMEIIKRGPRDRGWKTLVGAIAHANNIPVEAVEKILTKRRNQIIGLEGVSGPELGRKSEAEAFREFEKMPSDLWVRTPVGERRIKILETDPVLYARRLLATGTARMGVIDAFGQDIGEQSPLNDLRKRFIDENTGGGFNAEAVWERAMRLAHAIPVNDRLISPSNPIAPAARAVTETLGVVKEGLMSLRGVSNLPEFLGAPREFAGLGPTLKVMGQDILRALRFKPMREAVKAHIETLERKGVITEEGFTGHPDPTRPFSSAARLARQILSTITGGRPVEGKQERDFGRAASMRGDIMKGRKGKEGRTLGGERDVQRLMSVGYDEPAARNLAYGGGTEAEYDTMLRTAQKRIIGANVKGADLSNLEHSRVASAMWYSRWAHMNIRQGARTLMAVAKGMERAFSEPGLSPADRARRVGASAAQLMSWVMGRTASNAAGTLLMSLATNGTLGAQINVNEAKNDIAGYLMRSFTYGVFGGPYGAIIRNMGQNLSDQGKGIFTPIMIGEEIINAVQGDDRYTDMSGADRIGALVRRLIPATKVFTQGILSGGGDGPRAAAAEKAYWNWRRDMDMTSKYAGEKKSNPYQYAISRVVDALEKNDTAKAREAMKEALSLKGKNSDSPMDSLRRRLLLTSTKADERRKLQELLPALKERIGAEAYEELVKRDQRILDFMGAGGE